MKDKERREGKKQGVRKRERVVPNDSRGKLYRDRLNPNERVARLDSITLSVPSALTLVSKLDLVGSPIPASFIFVAPRLVQQHGDVLPRTSKPSFNCSVSRLQSFHRGSHRVSFVQSMIPKFFISLPAISKSLSRLFDRSKLSSTNDALWPI